jgi:hypothetical protein
MSGGLPVVAAANSGAGRAVSAAGVGVPGSRWTVRGAGTAVSGQEAVLVGAESCHSAREFLDASQKLIVCLLANARERGAGNRLDDAVSAVCREV